jgi:hemerythrin
MARFRCPNHAKNKEQHLQLQDALADFSVDYAALGLSRELLQRLHTTMVWWITSHILKVDIGLKGCVTANKSAGG